jgi:hypothetical protein
VECVVSISAGGRWLPSMNIYTAPAPGSRGPQNGAEKALFAFAILTLLYLLSVLFVFLKHANIYRLKRWSVIIDLVQLGMMVSQALTCAAKGL